MSYMRTSEKNCDVYVYNDGHNYITHVAHRRVDEKYSGPPVDLHSFAGKSIEYIEKELAKGFVDFDNPYAGKDYSHSTAAECLDNLKMLQQAGVGVSKSGMRILEQEAAKEKKGL